jgi:hypothetical protein
MPTSFSNKHRKFLNFPYFLRIIRIVMWRHLKRPLARSKRVVVAKFVLYTLTLTLYMASSLFVPISISIRIVSSIINTGHFLFPIAGDEIVIMVARTHLHVGFLTLLTGLRIGKQQSSRLLPWVFEFLVKPKGSSYIQDIRIQAHLMILRVSGDEIAIRAARTDPHPQDDDGSLSKVRNASYDCLESYMNWPAHPHPQDGRGMLWICSHNSFMMKILQQGRNLDHGKLDSPSSR